jgi:hypothetical protein
VCDRAGLWGSGGGQCLRDEAEVTAEVAADVMEESAAAGQPGGYSGVEGSLRVAALGGRCPAYHA